MWVVALGDDAEAHPALSDWLEEVTALGGGRVVIVPGLGHFGGHRDEGSPDARWSHERPDLDATALHNLQVLARAQSAECLRSWCPRLGLAHDEHAIGRILLRGHVPLWSALSALCRPEDGSPRDAGAGAELAAGLTIRLLAERLILTQVDGASTRSSDLDDRLAPVPGSIVIDTVSCPVDHLPLDDLARWRAELLQGHRGPPLGV